MKYSTIEKQSFSLVKAISYLITYIVSCHIISYVPHYPVKMFLNKQLREGIWETWLAKIQEYDMEIKPLKVIKEQGLCKMMSGIEDANINPPNTDDTTMQDISLPRSEWYKDIVFYMKSKHFPIELSYTKIRDLKMNINQYVLVSRILFEEICMKFC